MMTNTVPLIADDAPVRVRFCPSPTGTPHVGLIRTALFNWAYARHREGKLIFRIEDTDAARDSEESYQQLLEALQWLGLDWDEGVEVGGPHGPYRQSERGEIYQDVIAKLQAGGFVYESYSTPEEVEARHRAAGRDPKLGYDGFDRELTAEQISAFQAEGRKPALRLRMPDTDLQVNDLVRGQVRFPQGTVPDFVVVRPNGAPLYTLVNPVDDALMGITHVLRGEDLLSSTPRQLALYQALYEVGVAQHLPEFGHLPYVMGQGNKKLSKRDPESSLFRLRDWGYIREGLLNYLALLGWSISPDEDIFSLEEMVAAFDVKDVLSNPARFDLKKAQAINGTHIRLLSAEEFRERLLPYLQAEGLVGEKLSPEEETVLKAAAPLIQERVQVLSEAPGMLRFLLVANDQVAPDAEALKGMPENLSEVLTTAITALDGVAESDWETEKIQAALREALIDGMGLKPRLAFGPVRTGISGRKISPPLFESLEILGKEDSLARLRAFQNSSASSKE